MSKKVSTYFPKYQLRRKGGRINKNEIWFEYTGIHFVTKIPLFGATETQKAALEWAWHKMPPVICLHHEAPTTPDKKVLDNCEDLHYQFYPYAMVVATLECLGEETPRKIKIYFCDAELHEDNHNHHAHVRFKMTRIEAL